MGAATQRSWPRLLDVSISWALAGLMGVFLLLSAALSEAKTPLTQGAVKGVLDLRQWNPQRDEPVALQGQWRFYWRKLVPPSALSSVAPTGLIEFPKLWGGHVVKGQKLSSHGFATYHLRILLSKPQAISFRLNRLYSSYKLFLDGKEMVHFGKVGQRELTSALHGGVKLISYKAGKEVDVVLQVANFFHRKGGAGEDLWLSSPDKLARLRSLRLSLDVFLFACLFTIGLFYLLLYALLKQGIAPLVFALGCAGAGYRALVTNGNVMMFLFPQMDYSLVLRGEYISTYLFHAMCISYLRLIFPEDFPQWAYRPFMAFFVVMGLFPLVAPVWLFTWLFWLYVLSFPPTAALLLYVATRSQLNRRAGSQVLLGSMIIVSAFGAYDIFQYARGEGIGLEVSGLGLLTIIIGQATFLASRLAKAFETTRLLSLQLEAQNKQLLALNEAAQRFVPSAFLKLLGKDELSEVQLGDQVQREMTVLFSDIRSFTTLSEGMTPKQNFAFINEYLQEMEPKVHEHRGFIDKYIGDAVMALFEHSAEDSLQAGLGMLEALTSYNERRAQRGEVPVRIGIGLNTGSLMLGTIGGTERMDGTVISDAVNLAARIEGMNKIYGTSLLMSEFTYQALYHPERFQIRVIDRVKVRGKQHPVTIYEVYDAEPPHIKAQKEEGQEAFEAALTLYMEGDFPQALTHFQKLSLQYPDDKAAEVFISRCQNLITQSPSRGDEQGEGTGSSTWSPPKENIVD